ncbi:MAG: xylulokinase [Burkholderiales bacterium]|nr:xylulokinase [Burkholderiales bacterium]
MSRSAPDAWLMGIDIGAGSLKTMIIGTDGRVAGSAATDIATASPQPGWSEQDPAQWWQALCSTVPRALTEAGLPPDAIAAVAFSAGAHTPVLEDARGHVIRPAILWSDQRSGAETRELNDRYGDEILAIGCNRAAPTWTQSQLLWLSRHEPDALARTKRLYVAKDWLRSRLTGTWETDPTEAVGTLLFDPHRQAWSERLCAMIGFDRALLPPIVRPTTIVGPVTAAAARACGLAAGTPVVCGSSDTSVEAYGAGAIAPGNGAIKLATAATVSIIGREPHVHPTLINYPFAVPDHWYAITATNSCASAHRWLRDRFFTEPGQAGAEAFAAMDRMAADTGAGADGLLFHPYLQGERAPYWDPLLRADFIGMTFRHEPRHFARAFYEGIAFSLRDALDQLRAQGLDLREARIIGGGARSATWRQIVADVLDVTIQLPKVTDASFGAALIAGVGIGVFADEVAAVGRCVAIDASHAPDPARRARYDTLHGIYRDAATRLTDINHRLSALG